MEILPHDFRLATRQEFCSFPFDGNETLPSETYDKQDICNLVKRSYKNELTHFEFVLFDPNDNDDGFMIWGNDKNELIKECYEAFDIHF